MKQTHEHLDMMLQTSGGRGKFQWDNGPLVDDGNGVTGMDVQKGGCRI
jgi:hypothetical protein